MSSIKNWWAARLPAFRAAVNTAWQATAGSFAILLLGLTGDLINWANDKGEFPNVSVFAKGLVAAGGGFAAALVAYGFRRWKPPSFDPAEQTNVNAVAQK